MGNGFDDIHPEFRISGSDCGDVGSIHTWRGDADDLNNGLSLSLLRQAERTRNEHWIDSRAAGRDDHEKLFHATQAIFRQSWHKVPQSAKRQG